MECIDFLWILKYYPDMRDEMKSKAFGELKRLGYPEWRGDQEKVVLSVLSGHDTFGIMATGVGKTLCYQIPSALMDGWSIVFSPLVALMNDQVSRLVSNGVHAIAISSEDDTIDRIRKLEDVRSGDGIAFMSPEMADTDDILNWLRQNPPSLAIFDEAHCISTWGRDFRPGYVEVGNILKKIEGDDHILRLALTASAGSAIVDDVISLTGMTEPEVIISSMARKNIALGVMFSDNDRTVVDYVRRELQFRKDQDRETGKSTSAIIYCPTRKECESLVLSVQDIVPDVSMHHSGMEMKERLESARRFMTGQSGTMIATMGFGMGIDRNDISMVIHTQIPPTPEAWYQEIGRAGRDPSMAASAIGHITPGFTKEIRIGNDSRDDSYAFSIRMSKAVFGHECRMQSILSCMGESSEPCGKCDNCNNMNSYDIIDDDDVLWILDHIANDEDLPQENDVLLIMDSMFINGLIDYSIEMKPWGKPQTHPVMTIKGHGVLKNGNLGCHENILVPVFRKPWPHPEILTPKGGTGPMTPKSVRKPMSSNALKRFDIIANREWLRFADRTGSPVLSMEEAEAKARQVSFSEQKPSVKKPFVIRF